MFSFLIKLFSFSCCFTSPMADASTKEWVSLGPVIKNTTYTMDRGEEDSSVWVIFAKQMGDENFMIRFPENPTYAYPTPEELKVFSQWKGETYTLRVLKSAGSEEVEAMIQQEMAGSEPGSFEVVKTAEKTWDLVYRKDGKSVAVRYFLSFNHLFILQSENSIFHRENHQKFVDSLDVIFHKK